MKSKSLFHFAILIIIGAMAPILLSGPPSYAQQDLPTIQIEIPPPQVRTWKEIKAAAALEASSPPPPVRKTFILPTGDIAAYEASKAKASQTPPSQEQKASSMEGDLPPVPPTTLNNPFNFEGFSLDTAGSWPFPDTHGAAGPNHFLEVTNSHLDIYQKAAPNSLVTSATLASFFGYTTEALFEARAIYDASSQRWIIIANAFAESATLEKFFIAVSQTSDPTGAFYIYQVNVSDGHATYAFPQWQFPQVGINQDAVIFTANFYNQNGQFVDARMFTVGKSLLYDGPNQTLTPTLITGLKGTLAPPIVLDANPNTYLVAADVSTFNQVWVYTLTNSVSNPPTLSAPTAIPVTPFSVPPHAKQPGTTVLLDTYDPRFLNASTQIGNSLFQVHTINIGGYARPRFYEFDTVNNQVIQSGTFSRSDTSYDFNASIAANRFKDVFVTWSATDPSNSVNAEVRFSGRRQSDSPGVISFPGSLLYGSATFYNYDDTFPIQRWGNYSAVSLDPADATEMTAWIVNERILGASSWGSRIGNITFNPAPSPPHSARSLGGVYLLLLLDDE